VQQPEEVVLAGLEVVSVEGLAQAAHRVLTEEREQYPGAGPTLFENATWWPWRSFISEHEGQYIT
jgi:hypothetical protein